MNTVNNFVTINLWLNLRDVLEIAILLMTYLIKYELVKLKQHISCECKCKFEFDGKKLIQINSRITINVGVSEKNIIYVKIMFGILLQQLQKWKNVSKHY